MSTKARGSWDRVQEGSMCGASSCPLPAEGGQCRLLPATTCDNTRGVLPTRKVPWALVSRVFIGASSHGHG